MTHGLYLFRGGSQSATPLFEGTQKQCRQQVDQLPAADRLRGWTIAPLPYRAAKPRNSYAWACVGFGILAFVLITAFLSLKGHIR